MLGALNAMIWTWMKLWFGTGVTQCFIYSASGGVKVHCQHCFHTSMHIYLPNNLFCHFFACMKSTKHASKIKTFLHGWKFITDRLSRKVENINLDHCFAKNFILCESGPIKEPEKNFCNWPIFARQEMKLAFAKLTIEPTFPMLS